MGDNAWVFCIAQLIIAYLKINRLQFSHCTRFELGCLSENESICRDLGRLEEKTYGHSIFLQLLCRYLLCFKCLVMMSNMKSQMTLHTYQSAFCFMIPNPKYKYWLQLQESLITLNYIPISSTPAALVLWSERYLQDSSSSETLECICHHKRLETSDVELVVL